MLDWTRGEEKEKKKERKKYREIKRKKERKEDIIIFGSQDILSKVQVHWWCMVYIHHGLLRCMELLDAKTCDPFVPFWR